MAVLDVWVDGFNLNTTFSGCSNFSNRIALPGRRHSEVVAPGQSGVTPADGGFDSRLIALTIWVEGGLHGATPTAAQLSANLSNILARFSLPGLRDIRYTGEDGIARRAMCRVSGATDSPIFTGQTSAEIKIILEMVDPFWRSVGEISSLHYATGSTFQPFTPACVAQSTAPIFDAWVEIRGPLLAPELTVTKDLGGGVTQTICRIAPPAKIDTAAGLTDVIRAGDSWWFSAKTFRSDLFVPIGYRAEALNKYSGAEPYFLALYPGCQIAVTGTGATSSTRIEVRANASYM